uniref:Neur_chan_LBD domain-containing protein n=1 Tax=Panagrellus redivivus TaxID=6233 RepID=A0A7E4ZTG0_PANRE
MELTPQLALVLRVFKVFVVWDGWLSLDYGLDPSLTILPMLQDTFQVGYVANYTIWASLMNNTLHAVVVEEHPVMAPHASNRMQSGISTLSGCQ